MRYTNPQFTLLYFYLRQGGGLCDQVCLSPVCLHDSFVDTRTNYEQLSKSVKVTTKILSVIFPDTV